MSVRVLHMTVGLGLGGMENLLVEHVSRLDRSRVDVQVLALKEWGPAGGALRERGVPVTALNARGRLDARLLFGVRSFLRRHRFDVVHSHLLWSNALACLFKGKSRVVWHEHDTDEWMGPADRWLERLTIGRCDRLLAISAAVAERVRRRAPWVAGRLEVLPNAIPVERDALPREAERSEARRRLGVGESDLSIGYVGRLIEPKKGLSALIEAFSLLRGAEPRAKLTLVGDGPARGGLERLAEERGLAGRAAFVGERRDVRALYPGFDVLALPSRWEGLGLVLLEAMEAGVPVVASRVGGIPEVVEQDVNGLLVPPDDPPALAQALRDVLSSPERARRLGAAGFRRVREDFDVRRNVKRLEDIYLELARWT